MNMVEMESSGFSGWDGIRHPLKMMRGHSIRVRESHTKQKKKTCLAQHCSEPQHIMHTLVLGQDLQYECHLMCFFMRQ